MEASYVTLFSFVLATTFSPGPNNIASASLGLNFGYRGALPFIGGVVAGFFLVMLAAALFAASLLRAMPELQPALRVVGALYIAWLALQNLRSGVTQLRRENRTLGFINGFLLQPLNPKAVIYGLTLYSTFLDTLSGGPLLLCASAAALAAATFVATSSWALGAAAFSWVLRRAWASITANVILSLLLLYVAAELSGLVSMLAG